MKINFTKKSFKEYQKLPLNYKKLVDKTLKKFKNGIPVDIKSVLGTDNIYRIRTGRYRLLFIRISPDILIIKIQKREGVYK